MEIRKSTVWVILLLAGGVVLAGLLFIYPLLQRDDYERRLARSRQLTLDLRLTDLCLFTEARYTRHLSQADLHSPFQDYPLSFDLFPSGSLVRPPYHLLKEGY